MKYDKLAATAAALGCVIGAMFIGESDSLATAVSGTVIFCVNFYSLLRYRELNK